MPPKNADELRYRKLKMLLEEVSATKQQFCSTWEAQFEAVCRSNRIATHEKEQQLAEYQVVCTNYDDIAADIDEQMATLRQQMRRGK